MLLHPDPHVPGRHCASSALRDIAHFGGHRLSEAMCFGLAAGLGFTAFTSAALSPTRQLHGRSATLEADFFRRLGIAFAWRTEPDAGAGWAAVRRTLDAGVPVLLQADLHYLPYYASTTHFAGHVIAAWGYEEDRGVALVSDTHFPGLQEVPLDALAAARTAHQPPWSLQSNWFPGLLPRVLPPLAVMVRAAVAEQATAMLGGTREGFGTAGVEGMAVGAAAFPEWAEAPDAGWCARFAYQVIERRGTGGGAFRRLYRDFLTEAAKAVPEVGTLAPAIHEIATRWTTLASRLKDASEAAHPDFRAAGSLLAELGDRERMLWTRAAQLTAR